MMDDLGSWGIAATVIYVFTIWVPPAGMIVGTLLMWKPAISANKMNNLLKSETIYELPSWINECSNGDQQLFVDEKQITYEEINPEFDTFVNCINIARALSSIVLGLALFGMAIYVVCGGCRDGDCNNPCIKSGNDAKSKREYMEKVKRGLEAVKQEQLKIQNKGPELSTF